MQARNVTRWNGGIPETRSVVPTAFGPARAEEIWAQRKPMGANLASNSDMTWEEEAYVYYIWDVMCEGGKNGHTCWMDAFQNIRLSRLPQLTPAS